MYKEWISRQTHGIVKNDSYEAEPLEVKLRKATEEKKPIEAVAPMIYTEKSKGVIPEHDIRTDRFEIAQAAMEKLNSVKFAETAKTEEILGGQDLEKQSGREAGEATPKGTPHDGATV